MAKEALIEEFKKHGLLPPDYEPPSEGEPPVGKWVRPGSKPAQPDTKPPQTEPKPPLADTKGARGDTKKHKRAQSRTKKTQTNTKSGRLRLGGDVRRAVERLAAQYGLDPSTLINTMAVNELMRWGGGG